jgi:hypothetical protein
MAVQAVPALLVLAVSLRAAEEQAAAAANSLVRFPAPDVLPPARQATVGAVPKAPDPDEAADPRHQGSDVPAPVPAGPERLRPPGALDAAAEALMVLPGLPAPWASGLPAERQAALLREA